MAEGKASFVDLLAEAMLVQQNEAKSREEERVNRDDPEDLMNLVRGARGGSLTHQDAICESIVGALIRGQEIPNAFKLHVFMMFGDKEDPSRSKRLEHLRKALFPGSKQVLKSLDDFDKFQLNFDIYCRLQELESSGKKMSTWPGVESVFDDVANEFYERLDSDNPVEYVRNIHRVFQKKLNALFNSGSDQESFEVLRDYQRP